MNRPSTCLLITSDRAQSLLGTALEKLNVSYTPYGYSHHAPFKTAHPGFNGEASELTGNHYSLGNGYRLYNAILAGFHSADSWSPFGQGGFNCYVYCNSDPTNNSDPSGHTLRPRVNLAGQIMKIYKKPSAPPAKEIWAINQKAQLKKIINQAAAYDKTVNDGTAFDNIVGRSFNDQQKRNLNTMNSYQKSIEMSFATEGGHPDLTPFAKIRKDGTIGLYIRHLETTKQFFRTKMLHAPTPAMRKSAQRDYWFAEKNLKAYIFKHQNINERLQELPRIKDFDHTTKVFNIREPLFDA